MTAQCARVWEYTVRPDRLAVFLEHYGPDGAWVALFRGADGYLGTELLQDRRDPHRFVTIDRWAFRAEWEAFRTRRAERYEALDVRCAGLTRSERDVGCFEAM